MVSIQLFDLAIRSSLLLVAAVLVARVLELRSASAAHRSLIAALACIPLLPLSITIAPEWKWTVPVTQVVRAGHTPVSPGQAAREHEPPGDRVQELTPPPHQANEPARSSTRVPGPPPPEWSTVTGDERQDPASAAETPRLFQEVAASDSPASATPQNSFNWVQIAMSAWLAVAGVLLFRAGWCLFQLQRFSEKCAEAPAAITAAIRDQSLQCGLACRVKVLQSAGNTMPMACWLGRWVIILPAGFETWPRSLRETILLHELGHIARRDAWADLLAQCVARVLWLSPLAWLAAWDVRRLRERACDEWALQRGDSDAKQYALSLVEVVSRCQPSHPRIVSAMAETHDLESRLKWLLSRSHPQSSQPIVGVLAVLAALSIAMAVATAQPTEPTQLGGPQDRTADGAESIVPVVIVSREPSPLTADSPKVSVSGSVSDRAGNPLTGADVVLRVSVGGVRYGSGGFPHARDVLARSVTDAQGRFRFDQIAIPPRFTDAIRALAQGEVGAQLLVWADGHALSWQAIRSFHEGDKAFELLPAAEVSGVVVDEQGNLVERANVEVVGLTKAADNIDAFLRGPNDLNLMRSEVKFRTTAHDGRFVLSGMPRDYRISIQCTSVAGHRAFFLIDTGTGTNDEASYRNAGQGTVSVHRTPIHVTAKQQPWIRIRVVDHEGRPVSGGGVEASTENRYGGSAEVSQDGIAVLIVNQPGIHEVRYAGDPLEPIMGLVQSIDIRPRHTETVEMKLLASRALTGHVVDGDTGEPIPGVYVAATRRAADQASQPTPRPMGSVVVSGVDGSFEMPVTEGVYQLSIRHDVNGYFVPIAGRQATEPEPGFPTVTIAAGDFPDDVVIRIARGLVVEGVVNDRQGLPAAGLTVRGESEGRPYREAFASTDSQGRFRLDGLSPYAATRITTWSDSGTAEQVIDAAVDHPWDKTLRQKVNLTIGGSATLVGRVVRGGEPQSGIRVRLRRAPPAQSGQRGTRFRLYGETTTDGQGRYRLSGLRNGDRYRLEVEPLPDAEVRDWTYQSPYSHTVDVERDATIELPDAVLKDNGQSLAGIVVDPDGRPVGGISVSARLASGAGLSRPQSGPPPWTETDENGRFRLTHLPEEPISLMAYKANPAGGRIRYPSHASPDINDQDVRIILDPKLQSEIEDLDSRR